MSRAINNIFTFRYTKSNSFEKYKPRFSNILGRYALELKQVRKVKFPGFTEKDLSHFITSILSSEDLQSLANNGSIPLSMSRQRRLGNPVDLNVLEYEKRDKSLRLIIRHASGNV